MFSPRNIPTGVRLKYLLLSNYWWIIPAILAALIVFFIVADTTLQIAIPAIATLLSIFYFLQKQKLEETRLFREIFHDFNARYDEMNERLALLREKPADQSFDAEERSLLIDYFNLCGEEYLYFRHGFIYPDVWTAWTSGIRDYLRNERIRDLWLSELSTGSYYGIPRDP